MSNTYYNSLSGMLAASYGLQNTSNNIANMQSHGFKRSDVFYSSLGNGEDGNGHGVHVGGSTTNFSQGSHTQTGNSTDLAVVGQGFFIIRLKNNELVYTRDGSFEFKNGFLVDKRNGGLVQGYNSAGNLVPIRDNGPNSVKGKASREIFLNGDFAITKSEDKVGAPDQGPYSNVEFELKNIYDDRGKAHTIKFVFKNTKPIVPPPTTTDTSNTNDPSKTNTQDDEKFCKTWELVSMSCTDMEVSDYWGELNFMSLDSGIEPIFGNSIINFTLNGKQTVNVHFGSNNDGTDKSVTIREATSGISTAIQIYQNDGFITGNQIECFFDENGQISYYYDNDQTVKGVHIGLARIDDMENNLIQTQDNYFKTKINKNIHYGRPNHQGFSAIRTKELENSNVDSTTEFANIVVLQRMFQACSQIMDIDKQLLQELESKS